MNPKRNHHVLPRLYLKGFVATIDEPFIWEYKKGGSFSPGEAIGNNPQRKSIGRPCAQRDYYAYKDDNGEDDFERIENLLEEFEKPSILVLDKLRTRQPITNAEKAEFAFYITQMNRRVPDYREELAKRLPQAAADLEPEVRKKFHLPDSEETQETLRKIFERTESEEYKKKVHLDVLAKTRDSRVTDVLRRMKWRFFVAPVGLAFITADNPMFYFKGLGLLKPASEVSFPISTNIALVASWHDNVQEGFLDADSQRVKELNRRTASRASQRAYFWRAESWVTTLLNKSSHRVQPIP